MLDLKFLRENPETVKENIRRKFQEKKLPLVDEVIELDAAYREAKREGDEIRASRNRISKQIGALMAQGKREEAEEVKRLVTENAAKLAEVCLAEVEQLVIGRIYVFFQKGFKACHSGKSSVFKFVT